MPSSGENQTNGERVIRKRKRKVFSCDACHRQKVKCDRKQPCSRCIAGNRADLCVYQNPTTENSHEVNSVEDDSVDSPTVAFIGTNGFNSAERNKVVHRQNGSPPSYLYTNFRKNRAYFSGRSHWSPMCYQFREIIPFLKRDPKAWSNMMHIIKELKTFYPRKVSRSFPFGDGMINTALIGQSPLSYLAPKEVTIALVEHYLITFDKIFPLLELDEFKQEFEAFCNMSDPPSKAWVAQVLMMAALACQANPPIPSDAMPGGPRALSQKYIDGAEISFLAQGNFMSKPTITVLRVLAMIGIAKQMEIATLHDSNGLWVYASFVTRTAMSQNFHLSPSLFKTMPKSHAKMHQKVWGTILLQSILISLESGHQLLIDPEDFDPTALYDPADEPYGLHPRQRPLTYLQIIARMFPTVSAITNKVNSTSPSFNANEFQQHDMCLRNLIQTIKQNYSSPFLCSHEAFLKKTLLEIILHRCLLCLHYDYLLKGYSSHDPPLSRATIHSSSSYILQLHDALHTDMTRRWVATLLVTHLTIPAAYLCVCMRNDDFDEVPNPSSPESARDRAWSNILMASSRAKENLTTSIHSFKIYRGYTAVVTALQAEKEGRSIAQALYNSANDIIANVEEAFGRSVRPNLVQTQNMLDSENPTNLMVNLADPAMMANGGYTALDGFDMSNIEMDANNLFSELFYVF